MGNYASVSDVKMRLIPYKADNPLFTDERIDEILEGVEGEIDGALLLLGYGIPFLVASAPRDVAVLKQRTIKAVVAEVLLQGYTELTDKQLQDARDARDAYLAWLEKLRAGGITFIESTTTARQGGRMVIETIDLQISEPSDDSEAEFS